MTSFFPIRSHASQLWKHIRRRLTKPPVRQCEGCLILLIMHEASNFYCNDWDCKRFRLSGALFQLLATPILTLKPNGPKRLAFVRTLLSPRQAVRSFTFDLLAIRCFAREFRIMSFSGHGNRVFLQLRKLSFCVSCRSPCDVKALMHLFCTVCLD